MGHHLGRMVKDGAEVIQSYLIANYCPGLDDSSLCEEHLAEYYVWMLEAIVNHFFVDGAVHICQTMGVCDARKYTCDGCVEGVKDHFPPMHAMAMEKFMIPVEICNTQPVC